MSFLSLLSPLQLWGRRLPLLCTHITISHISKGPKVFRANQPFSHELKPPNHAKNQPFLFLSRLSPVFYYKQEELADTELARSRAGRWRKMKNPSGRKCHWGRGGCRTQYKEFNLHFKVTDRRQRAYMWDYSIQNLSESQRAGMIWTLWISDTLNVRVVDPGLA